MISAKRAKEKYGEQIEKSNIENSNCDEALRFAKRNEIFQHKSNMCVELGNLIAERKVLPFTIDREMDNELYNMACFLECNLHEVKERYKTSDYKILIRCFTEEMVKHLVKYIN